MKKILVILAVTLALGIVAVQAASGPFLEAVSRRVFARGVAIVHARGVEISRFHFERAGFASFNSVTLTNFAAQVKTTQRGGFATERSFSVYARKLTLKLLSLAGPSFNLTGRNIDVYAASSGAQADQFTIWRFETRFNLDLSSSRALRARVRLLAYELARLMTEGRSAIAVDFSGTCKFMLGQKETKADLWVRPAQGEWVLTMDEEDLKMISSGLAEKLTDKEIELLSTNPLEAPRLLRIRDYARQISKEAHEKDPAVPEDAYRHILWSYLLAKIYGEGMARRCTDAHEIGAQRNTPADQLMDSINNSIGRRYAREGIAEIEVLSRALSDPAVIRSPENAPVGVVGPPRV